MEQENLGSPKTGSIVHTMFFNRYEAYVNEYTYNIPYLD